MATILVATDSSFLARKVEGTLTRAGYEVAVSKTDTEGTSLAPPDLVLFDVTELGGEGLARLGKVKAAFPQARPLLIVKLGQEGLVSRAQLELKTTGYLVTPLREETLLTLVQRALASS